MSDEGSGISGPRRLAIVVAIACVVAAVFVWMRRREPLVVDVAADREIVAPGALVQLRATVRRRDDRVEVDATKCAFKWAASAGNVAGDGRAASWSPPDAVGVTAHVTTRVECGDVVATGAIDLATAATSAPIAAGFAPATAAPTATTVAATRPPQQHDGDGAAPIIDEIIVEKREVCKGEPNLVTVRAHDPKGTDDAWLNTVIDAQPGSSVPLMFWTNEPKAPRTVLVYGKYNRNVTIAEVPHVTVLDCVAPYLVQVSYMLVPNTEDYFRFKVLMQTAQKQKAFNACAFEWDFGDGATTTTSDAFAEHSYLDRPQVGLETSFLVKVKLLSCDGDPALVGRTALTLRNNYSEQRESKRISGLVIIAEPRYPERGADNVVRQTALVRTWEPEPVEITRVTYRDTIPSQGPDPGAPVEISASSFLGKTHVGNDWIKVPLSVDLNAIPGWQMRRYELEGKTRDGVAVFGAFTLMAPGVIDRATSQKVDDQEIKDRLVQAMKILGKKQISDEELMQLEEQGKIPKLGMKPPTPAPGFTQPVAPATGAPKPLPPAPPPGAGGGGKK